MHAPAASRVTTAIVCALLLAVSALLSAASVLTKSPTYDEPMHAVSGWMQSRLGIYGLASDQPPLWSEWEALPNGPDALRLDAARYASATDREVMVTDALFRTEGVDGDAVIQRSRWMMLPLTMCLGTLLAIWAWTLGGTSAAIIATAFFSFDPGFLGHGILVKNDAGAALFAFALAWFTWKVGQRVTWGTALGLVLAFGLGVNVKFSIFLFAPVVAALLLARALVGTEWIAFGRALSKPASRLAIAAALCAAVGVGTWGVTWASYGCRYAPAPNREALLPMEELAQRTVGVQTLLAAHPGQVPSSADLASWSPTSSVRALIALDRAQLMPYAWTSGILTLLARATAPQSYLLGETSVHGHWYYFPLVFVVKLPTATVIAALLLLLARPRLGWNLAVVGAFPVAYLVYSMASNLNIGVRHLLPVLPFLYLGLGVAAAQSRRAAVLTGALAVFAMAETLHATPDFVAFFNLPAGGAKGGLRILGDSNLDWGQDLPALADWAEKHADKKLYLSYFGLAEPAAYGVKYEALLPHDSLPAHALVAVSASHLQGIGDALEPTTLKRLRDLPPTAVLGGTIYVYDLP